MATVLEQVRRAIKASSKTRYRLSKETGIGEPQLCKLMAGKAGLSIESLEELAKALGLEVVIRPKRKKGR